MGGVDPQSVNLRPGTPERNCSMCENFEAGRDNCKLLQTPVTAQMLCDSFTSPGDQAALIDKLFGGPASE